MKENIKFGAMLLLIIVCAGAILWGMYFTVSDYVTTRTLVRQNRVTLEQVVGFINSSIQNAQQAAGQIPSEGGNE